MMIVALTGGIGSGKSTVAGHFAKLGVPIIDTDLIARELVAPGSQVLQEISARFGTDILDPQGHLKRDRLRDIVFADEPARHKLEAIMHPRIRTIVQQRLSELPSAYTILVIPLLIEIGQADLADRILVVDLPESLQVKRVQQRSGLSMAQIESIMLTQCGRATRLAAADDLIDNGGNLATLCTQVETLHQKYLELSGQPDNSESISFAKH